MSTKFTIDLLQLGITWQPNKTYRIQIDEGFVVEVGNNQSISPEQNLTFTTPGRTFVSSTVPADNQTMLSPIIELTFDRNVVKKTGNIYLYKVGTPDILETTVSITGLSLINNRTIQVNLKSFLDPTSSYYIRTDAGIVADAVFDIGSSAINDSTTFNFTTPSSTTLSSTVPANNSSGLDTLNFSLVFNRNITLGTGNIYIYKVGTPDQLVLTLPVAQSTITTNTLSATGLFDGNSTYYITTDAGIVLDTFGFNFGGISNSTTFRFSTDVAVRMANIGVDDDSIYFGETNAINGDIIISSSSIGTFGGRVFVHNILTNQLLRTFNDPLNNSDFYTFGASVDISNLYIAIGAPVYNSSASASIRNNTRVYIHNLNDWSLRYTLTNPNRTSSGNNNWFGNSVSIAGNFTVVGSPEGIFGPGKAFIYNNSTGSLLFTLTDPSPADGNNFGFTVRAFGNFVAVGAPDTKQTGVPSLSEGKVHIYNLTNGQFLRTINIPVTPSSSTFFGRMMYLNGNNLIVNQYIFDITTGQLIRTLPDVITSVNATVGDRISRVAINNNYALIGRETDDEPATSSSNNSGRAYLYRLSDGQLVKTFVNPNVQGTTDSDNFGYNVYLSNNYAVVSALEDQSGTNSGIEYVWRI